MLKQRQLIAPLLLSSSLLVSTVLLPSSPTVAAAAPSLNATGMVAPNLTLTTSFSPGPYFGGEVLIGKVTLKNTSKQPITLLQGNSCRFNAQVVVVGGKVTTPTLPPAALCTGASTTVKIAAGSSLTDTVTTVLPVVHGDGKKTYQVTMTTFLQLTLPNVASLVQFSLRSGKVSLPTVVENRASGGNLNQRLSVSIKRDTQGFTVQATDGQKKAVSGLTGWYVVHAPDGDLGWGIANTGRIYCTAGCQSGAKSGTYTATVTLVHNGYSIGSATLTYKA